MTAIINSVIATLLTALLAPITLTADIIRFAENERCYKAMLFTDNNGNFVPVVTFRSPFVGKRVSHALIQKGIFTQSSIFTDEGWKPSDGVSILFIKDGKPCYTVAPLTSFEISEKLSFLTSFNWFKGENVYDVFAKLAAFDELNYTNDFGEAGIYEDESLTGVIRQPWFTEIWRAKKEKLAKEEEKTNKKIVVSLR